MEPTDQLMHQLYQTTRAISKSLNHMLESQGLFSSEWTIIKVIKEQGSMSQTSLANYLNIEPAAISKSLFKLEQKGLIERRIGTDKREKSVLLTDAAVGKYPIWIEVVARHRKQMLGEMSKEHQKELFLGLKTLYLNAQRDVGSPE
ncbi:MAG: transcriptional regulator, MarR family [Firmicutes bacterium]|nr:transcriptional regulator, MarR family [Bacillota bacterium]